MRRGRLWFGGLAVLAIAGIATWIHFARAASSNAKDDPKKRPPPEVPVQVVRATRKDVPITLEGLGTVTAFNTVTVRAQVDGRIERIAFEEGREVKKGELLVQIDPRPFQIQLEESRAALARDKAMLDNAKLAFERATTLREQKLIAQQDVDDKRTALAQLEAAIQADNAQIADRALAESYTRITAPITGQTGIRLVDAGNLVRAADPNGIVLLTQLDPIAVLFTLSQDDLPRVAAAMAEGPLEVEIVSRTGDQALGRGKVQMIDNQISMSTGTFRMKAVFDNPKHTLWPNQFVKARVIVAVRKSALVIPTVAVQRGPKGALAYVVAQDGTASAKPVELGEAQGELTIVKRGVNEGDQVVVEGQQKIAPGAKVAIAGPPAQTASSPGASEGRAAILTSGTSSTSSASEAAPRARRGRP